MLAIVLPLVGIFLLLLLCCGGGLVAYPYQTGLILREDPVDAVKDYFDAAVSRDCKGMIDRVTEETWRQSGASSKQEAIANCEAQLATVSVSITRPDGYELLSESGDTAVVRVFLPPADLPDLEEFDLVVPPSEIDYHLRRDGRRWLIDGPATGFNLGGADSYPGGLPDLDLPDLQGMETPEPDESGASETPDPPTAAELWGNRDEFTFRIELEHRTLTGDLRQLNRYDHPDCASAAVSTSVASDLANCLGRIEATFRGVEHSGIRVSQQVFTFPDPDAATAFANRFDGVWALELVSFTDPGDYHSYYSESRSQSVGPYVVLTLMVSAGNDDDSIQLARDHAHALHAETVNIFIWGGP